MKTHNIARINGAGSQLTAAFMERVQQSALPAAPQPVSVTPAEIPMILTLDELRPNPDNPGSSAIRVTTTSRRPLPAGDWTPSPK